MSTNRSVLCLLGVVAMGGLMAIPTWADQPEEDLGGVTIAPLEAGIQAGAPEGASPWITLPDCPEAVSRPAGAVVSGHFYVIGGESSGGARLGYVQEYDPVTGLWDNTNATMPNPASNVCAAVYGTDIYIPGGWDGSSYLTDLQVYQTATNSWTTVGTDPLPYAPSGAACASYGGKVFVFAGSTSGGYSSAAFAYDPVAPAGTRWSAIAPVPIAGGYGAAIPAVNGIFYAGFRDSGMVDRAEVYWYDPMADSWTTYPSLSTPRGGARMWTHDGKLAVGGGGWGSYLSSVEEYDLSAGTGGVWTAGNPLNLGCRTFAAAQDDLGSIMYAGAGWAGGYLSGAEHSVFVPTGRANVLVSRGIPYQGFFQNIYGGALWPEMTAALNEASNSVTVTPDLENISYMLEYDALWVDQRGLDSDPNSFLTPTEVANISTFIGTGRRVVMLGENSAWTNWNNQILGICGGSHGGGSGGTANTVLGHELTIGVAQIDIRLGGFAIGGAPLFDQNVATLWPACGEVLTILEVNSQESIYWPNLDNSVFFTNVADWIGWRDSMPFADGFESGDTSAWSSSVP